MRGERCSRCGTYVGWVGLSVDLVLVVTKLIVGIETGSRAVMSDSLYSVIDVVSSVLVILSVKVSRKHVDAEHPYGHGKVEFLGIAAVAIGIAVLAIFFLVRAVEELLNGEERISSPLAAVSTIVAIIACSLIWRYALCAGRRLGSPVILADAEHHKADAVSSLAVLGSVALSWVGLGVLDPIVAVLENLHVVHLSVALLRRGVDGLLDASVGERQTTEIGRVVGRVPGVLGVADVRARSVGSSTWIELKVKVAGHRRMSEAGELRRLIRAAIHLHLKHVANVVIEVVPAGISDHGVIDLPGQERGLHA